jgi:hypothetical protein
MKDRSRKGALDKMPKVDSVGEEHLEVRCVVDDQREKGPLGFLDYSALGLCSHAGVLMYQTENRREEIVACSGLRFVEFDQNLIWMGSGPTNDVCTTCRMIPFVTFLRNTRSTVISNIYKD